MTTPTSDIGLRMDQLPLTRMHAGVVAVCTFAMACALGEMSLSGALSAIVSTGPNKATSGELTALLSSVYVGAIIGAPAFGYLADRIGRRATLMIVLLWIALVSGAAGFTHGVPQLTLCRGLSGLALGALPPLVIAFLADLLPPGRRGALTLWCVAFATLGPASTLMFLRAMTAMSPGGVEGWRLTFWMLGLACTLTAVAASLLPESPRFLATRGRDSQAAKALARYAGSRRLLGGGLAAPAKDAAVGNVGTVPRRNRHLIFALFALSPWGTAAFPILWGAVLTQRGFALNDALFVVALSTLGPVLGNLTGSAIVDRIDRRHGLAGCSAVMVLAGALFVTSDVAWQVVIGAAAYGMAASIYLSILNLYAAEFFPTEGRGRRLASAWALNRLGAAFSPVLMVPLLRTSGPTQMFAVVACVILAGIVVTYLSPQGRQRLGLT